MKKNSKVIIAFLLMLLLITQLTSPVSALIQYDGVSVTPVIQAKTYWCWAACAEMVGKYFKPDTSKTQWDVVRATKGTEDEPYPNVRGTGTECALGASYVSLLAKGFKVTSALGNSDLVSEMKNDYPVIAGIRDVSNSNGHMVVITGTELRDINAQVSNYIYYIDPWDGTMHMCLYQAFCDGSYNGMKYTISIVVK